ncbi:MAG: MoxR family ATPase [Lentisphaerae bacterium]|nr:MoxR family ATPase [Lentisphaerota bacterium]
MREKLTALGQALGEVIRGKDDIIELLLVALAAEGSVLLHDVPGVGKTTLAKSLAACLNANFRRIQFTPDLLPTDIIGSGIYNPKDGELRFRKGPIFANIVLADEINRASPRTQSALLEAMSERQISADGVTYPLPSPFIVLATENPIEYQGTYSLPEAQLDRFALHLVLGYPPAPAELQLLLDRLHGDPSQALRPIFSCEEVVTMQSQVRQVKMDGTVVAYVLELVNRTRADKRVALGASPRAGLTLCRCAQAEAYRSGRTFVLPDDVKRLAVPVLAHRLVLDNQTKYAGISNTEIITDILDKCPVPK